MSAAMLTHACLCVSEPEKRGDTRDFPLSVQLHPQGARALNKVEPA